MAHKGSFLFLHKRQVLKQERGKRDRDESCALALLSHLTFSAEPGELSQGKGRSEMIRNAYSMPSPSLFRTTRAPPRWSKDANYL